jgi:hypothetical protein
VDLAKKVQDNRSTINSILNHELKNQVTKAIRENPKSKHRLRPLWKLLRTQPEPKTIVLIDFDSYPLEDFKKSWKQDTILIIPKKFASLVPVIDTNTSIVNTEDGSCFTQLIWMMAQQSQKSQQSKFYVASQNPQVTQLQQLVEGNQHTLTNSTLADRSDLLQPFE